MVISRHNSVETREPQVFVENGQPVRFYLLGTHEAQQLASSLTEGARTALKAKIERHGGVVCDREQDAHTVIVGERAVEDYRARYELLRRYAEPPSFVAACIRNRRYAHERVPQQPLGGRYPNGGRTEFTSEDDEHICRFLATVIPDPLSGGRTGQKIWKKLVEDAQSVPDLGWAKRHPWQSWRERYKRRIQMFDPLIEQIVKKDPPPADGKGLYPFSRHQNTKPFVQYEQVQIRDEEQMEDGEGEGEFEFNGEDVEDEQLYQDEEGEFTAADHPDDMPRLAPRDRTGHRRRTDQGPQRESPSAIEQARGRPRTRSAPGQDLQRHASPMDEFEAFENGPYEFDYRPGPEDAGPSGTQRTPSPIAPSPPPQPQRLHKNTGGRPKLPPPVVKTRERGPGTQVPMSSQATLVAPASQLPKPLSHRQQARAGPGPSTQTPRRAARRLNAVDTDDEDEEDDEEDEEYEDEEDEDRVSGDAQDWEEEAQGSGEEVPSYTVGGHTNEDEMDVERALAGNDEQSIELSRELSPELGSPNAEHESDDERMRQKLFNLAGSHKRRVVERDDDDDDDERFAEGLSFESVPTVRLPRPSLLPSYASSPAARSQAPPSTPRSVRIPAGDGDKGGYLTSSESAVPLPNTRASAVKNKRRRADPYNPPPGTRAQEALRVREQKAREQQGGSPRRTLRSGRGMRV